MAYLQNFIIKGKMMERGLTLVELLIALVISLIIIGAGFGIYIIYSRNFTKQADVTDMQQRGRVVLELLEEEIRAASRGAGCGVIRSYYDPFSGTTAGTDTFFLPFVYAYDTDPDTLFILYGDPDVSAVLRDTVTDPSSPIRLVSWANFSVGDVIMLTDGCEASLLEITSLDSANMTLYAAPGATPYNPPIGHNIFKEGGYEAGDRVLLLRSVSYFVKDSTIPTLMMDPDGILGSSSPLEISDGIEYIDVDFAGDFDGDSLLDDGDANGIPDFHTPTWVLTQNGWLGIRQVRLRVVLRTRKEDPSFYPNGDNPLTPEDEDDGYRRVLVEAVVNLRNLERCLK